MLRPIRRRVRNCSWYVSFFFRLFFWFLFLALLGQCPLMASPFSDHVSSLDDNKAARESIMADCFKTLQGAMALRHDFTQYYKQPPREQASL